MPDSSLGPTAKSDPQSPAEGLSPVMVSILVTPGDYLDRLTIAQIKVKRLTGEKQERANVELAALSRAGASLKISNPVTLLISQLSRINEALWTVEDTIRSLDSVVDSVLAIKPATAYYEIGPQLQGFVQAAREVYTLNTRRTALKAEINKEFGVTAEAREYKEVSNG